MKIDKINKINDVIGLVIVSLIGFCVVMAIVLFIVGGWFVSQKFPYSVYEFYLKDKEMEILVRNTSRIHNLKIKSFMAYDNESHKTKKYDIYKDSIEYHFSIQYEEKEELINPLIKFNGVYDLKNKKFLKAKDYINSFKKHFIDKLDVSYKRIK